MNALAFNLFFLVSGRVGQDILLDLRIRVYDHFQRLSLAFHERYTSGRVISRLTSDVEALAELLNQGFVNLINAVLLIGGIAVVLLVLDWQLAARGAARVPGRDRRSPGGSARKPSPRTARRARPSRS